MTPHLAKYDALIDVLVGVLVREILESTNESAPTAVHEAGGRGAEINDDAESTQIHN